MSYVDTYSPALLRPIARAAARVRLGIAESLPFHGEDLWTGYEFSWLAKSGKPRVAGLRLRIPHTSPNLIESKSMKFYLNSFALARFESRAEVVRALESDLAGSCGAAVGVELIDLERLGRLASLPGESLDGLHVTVDQFERDPDLLRLAEGAGRDQGGDVTETWHTHLFRSLCPITGQPDWASILVGYTGLRIAPEGLLRYLVSYRRHAAFHEDTVEQVFVDLMARCRPTALRVCGFFQRRGGLDINPYRSTGSEAAPVGRLARQ